jgi:hypothetical protein
MRRRYVLALVLVTALIFALVGTAVGHWVVLDSKGPTAECLTSRHAIDTGDLKPGIGFAYYNDNCR